jgi:hypothetical protein
MIILLREDGFGQSELAAAKKIKLAFEQFFLQNPCEGEVTILNYQLPSHYPQRDVDILVLLKIEDGNSIVFDFQGREIELEGGFIFNIETKSHSQFKAQGGNVWVAQPDGSDKNASGQAWNVKNNLLNYLKREFRSVPWVKDVIFLPMCSREASLAIFGSESCVPANFMDGSFSAKDLLSGIVSGETNNVYRNDWSAEAVDRIKTFLIETKSLPNALITKLEHLTIEALKKEHDLLFSDKKDYYNLKGSPGAGKTILMLGKCKELIEKGNKCLYLTYNKQLVVDLQRLQDIIRLRSQQNPLLSLRIETWDFFITKLYSFYNYFVPLGAPAPSFEEKTTKVLNRYSQGNRQVLANDENMAHKNIFRYSLIDYVFVDEAQDLPAEVFELLENLYSTSICLSLGSHQDYSTSKIRGTSNEIVLGKIYRQKELPSKIVNAFLEHTSLDHRYVIQEPVPLQLIGGKSLVYTGKVDESFYESAFEYLKSQGGSNIDLLHLHTREGDSPAESQFPHYYGGLVEQSANLKLDKFRYFHYNSCRGLEGTIVLFERIDVYYDWCLNLFGQEQAQKRLFIALTRVKDVAIFTFSNLNHWLYTDVVANYSRITNHFSSGKALAK